MPAVRPEATAPEGAAPDIVRDAGRGGLAVAFAKIYFIVTGLAQQVALPKIVGLDGYGALGTALSFAGILYNPITGTSIQGVSRAVAQAPGAEPAALRRTLLLHVSLAAAIAVLIFVAAPWVTALIGAPHVSNTIRILCAVILTYGVYTPLVGALNGRRRFVQQAGLDVLAATLRTLGLVVGAFVLSRMVPAPLAGVEGAAWGFVIGAVVVLLAALRLVGIGHAGTGGPSVRQHLAFIAPLFVGQFVLNLLLQADQLLLRTFAGQVALEAGLSPRAADPYVGAYRAAQLFAFLPYQLLIAVTFVLFPMLASAGKKGDRDDIRRYVATGLRLALIIAGAMMSVSSGLAKPLLGLVFGAEATAHGARALGVLAIGFGGFAIFGILTTVLNSLGHERASASVTAIAAGLVAAACFVWVRGTPLSDELLFRTAAATSTSIGLATVTAAFLVHRAVGGLVPVRVVLRVGAAVLCATALGRFLSNAPAWLAPALALAVVTTYAGVLVATRELGASDLALVQRVLRRSA